MYVSLCVVAGVLGNIFEPKANVKPKRSFIRERETKLVGEHFTQTRWIWHQHTHQLHSTNQQPAYIHTYIHACTYNGPVLILAYLCLVEGLQHYCQRLPRHQIVKSLSHFAGTADTQSVPVKVVFKFSLWRL